MNSAHDSRLASSGQPRAGQAKHGITSKAWWPWAVRLAKAAFFIIVAYLLINQAREVEWKSVLSTIKEYPATTLMQAAGFAAASYALYSCFDLLGRHYTGHSLKAAKVVTVNFISYAFNLNLGSLIGGVAFRYRLYSRLGLETAVITRVLFMSMMTNWLGYLLLAGLVFWLRPFSLPSDWKLGAGGLHILGMVLFAVAMAYMALCAFSRRRNWNLRGHEINLPPFKFAVVQLLMSSVNWLLIAATVYSLLGQRIEFTTVLGVLLVGAIAGVITHVPAGLGVLEAVFVALLSHQLPKSELLAALLTYRAIYYLAPLVIATVVYLIVESQAKKLTVDPDSQQDSKD